MEKCVLKILFNSKYSHNSIIINMNTIPDNHTLNKIQLAYEHPFSIKY